MTLWVCGGDGGCGTKYAVGLFRCPRCHNDEFFEDGDPMAKISRYGGASDATLPVPEPEAADASVSEPDVEETLAVEPLDVTEFMAGPAEPVAEQEGGEESSPGSSSSASTEKPQPTSEPSEPQTPKRARTTASRSRKAQTETSSASGTAGGQAADTSAADGAE